MCMLVCAVRVTVLVWMCALCVHVHSCSAGPNLAAELRSTVDSHRDAVVELTAGVAVVEHTRAALAVALQSSVQDNATAVERAKAALDAHHSEYLRQAQAMFAASLKQLDGQQDCLTTSTDQLSAGVRVYDRALQGSHPAPS